MSKTDNAVKEVTGSMSGVIPIDKQGCMYCAYWTLAREAKYYKVYHCTAVATNAIVKNRCLHFKWNGQPIE